MSSKRIDLKQNCFFVLSGLENPLGKVLAMEMSNRFKAGSLILLIESNEELLQEVKKDIQYMNNEIEVICCNMNNWMGGTEGSKYFEGVLKKTLESYKDEKFDLAFIMHNEGSLATSDLMEPQDMNQWFNYINNHLYAPMALNKEFLKIDQLKSIEKLIVNVTSSIMIQPMFFNGLHGSCKKARDMYFRSLAFEEGRQSNINVLSYGPGLFETHQPQYDVNNNLIDLKDLKVNSNLLKMSRVNPLQSALKLINILEEISFISGHDVDYYDTFVL